MAAGTLPNLLVIGAMKCGTSSVHRYLGLHPQIGMSARKELNFFVPPEPTPPPGGGGERALMVEPSTHRRGLDWYRAQISDGEVRGETSVAYSQPWYPGTAEMVAVALPDVRLLYLVRDPIERIRSHHAQFRARDGRSLEQALSSPGNPYLAASRYATALEPFLEQFARDHLLIVDADRLRERRRETMATIFAFLGVDSGFFSEEMMRERNRTDAKGRAYRAAERLRGGKLAGPALARLPSGLRSRAERALASDRRDPRPSLPAGLRSHLLEQLEAEIAGIEHLTGWDLARWRAAEAELR